MASTDDRPLSALPSVRARVVAFGSICVAGLMGAAIGRSLTAVQCDGSCDVPINLGMVISGVFAALGVGMLAVLALRAMGEWRAIGSFDDANPIERSSPDPG